MKKVIRLTEGGLHRIINKSVNKILREMGSDGPDWDEINSGEYSDEMIADDDVDYGPAITANDFDDIDVDSLDSYYNDDDNLDFEDMEDIPMDGDAEFYESRNRIGKIIRESIKKVLNEGIKAVDPDNAVPQALADKYGFTCEYAGFQNGLELWGKDIVDPMGPWVNDKNKNRWTKLDFISPMALKKALGITRFTTWSKSSGGMHVRITVEPNQKMAMRDSWSNFKQRPRRIGDYVGSGYGNKYGEFFQNPKNGHFKQIK